MSQTDTRESDKVTTEGEAVSVAHLEPVVLTVKQAAVKLQVSRWTIYELIRKRHLVSFKIGRRRVVPKHAVHDYVKKRAEEAN